MGSYNVSAVVGVQWGDEGKGRVVDYLASDAELVIRSRAATMPAIQSSMTRASSASTFFPAESSIPTQ